MQESPASPTSRLWQKSHRFGSVPYSVSVPLCCPEERSSFKCHKALTKSASGASLDEAPKHRHSWRTPYKFSWQREPVEPLPGPGCESLGFHFSVSRQRGCWTRGRRSGCTVSSQFQHPVPSEYRPLGGKEEMQHH